MSITFGAGSIVSMHTGDPQDPIAYYNVRVIGDRGHPLQLAYYQLNPQSKVPAFVHTGSYFYKGFDTGRLAANDPEGGVCERKERLSIQDGNVLSGISSSQYRA